MSEYEWFIEYHHEGRFVRVPVTRELLEDGDMRHVIAMVEQRMAELSEPGIDPTEANQ